MRPYLIMAAAGVVAIAIGVIAFVDFQARDIR